MSNAWFYYLFPLAICTIIALAPVVIFFKIRASPRAGGGTRFGAIAVGCAGIWMFGIGGAMSLAILLTSPTPWERDRLFQVLRTPPERIDRFVILPGATQPTLTASPVTIDDPARIRQIAEILRASREVSPNHPRDKWTAVVQMETQDGTCYFSVYATVAGDPNATLVSPKTTPSGDGWNLGDIRAEGLDRLLEEAVEAGKD